MRSPSRKKAKSACVRKELSTIKFRLLLDKREKKETIDWLVRNCHFFGLISSDCFPEDVNISISDEVKERKPLFYTPAASLPPYIQWGQGDMYIIKTGNAFSWVNHHLETVSFSKKNFFKKDAKKRTAEEFQKNGIIPEIFCEGDSMIMGVDVLPNFDFLFEDGLSISTPGRMSIIAGTPFDQCMAPLELIKIELKELRRIFPEAGMLERLIIKKLKLKHIVDSWRLWSQWTNNAKIKILSVLYLYFMKVLPLQRWISDNKEINNGKTFKKHRSGIIGNDGIRTYSRFDGFIVGPKELALFAGLRRQTIEHHILGWKSKDKKNKKTKIKSIFEEYPALSNVLKYEDDYHYGYKFLTADSSFGDFITVMREIILSPTIKKYI